MGILIPETLSTANCSPLGHHHWKSHGRVLSLWAPWQKLKEGPLFSFNSQIEIFFFFFLNQYRGYNQSKRHVSPLWTFNSLTQSCHKKPSSPPSSWCQALILMSTSQVHTFPRGNTWDFGNSIKRKACTLKFCLTSFLWRPVCMSFVWTVTNQCDTRRDTSRWLGVGWVFAQCTMDTYGLWSHNVPYCGDEQHQNY